MIVFITGGVKNGKSGLAQKIALELAEGGRRYYVATMIPSDGEDRERIRLHILDRAGMGFETIEQGRQILKALDGADLTATYLLDSLTALMLNELFPDPASCQMDLTAPERCAGEIEKFAKSVKNAVIVSDYIYSDAERYDTVTKTYQQGLARADRALAKIADVVIEVAAGNLILHKGVWPQ